MAKKGHLLEVNLSCPSELRDAHSDLPLAPEHITITPQMLSEYNSVDYMFCGQIYSFRIYVTNQDIYYT